MPTTDNPPELVFYEGEDIRTLSRERLIEIISDMALQQKEDFERSMREHRILSGRRS